MQPISSPESVSTSMGRRNRLCGSRVARSRPFALLRPRIRAAVGLDRAIREPLIAITTATRSSPLTTRGDGGIVEFSSTVAGPQPSISTDVEHTNRRPQATIPVLWIRSLAAGQTVATVTTPTTPVRRYAAAADRGGTRGLWAAHGVLPPAPAAGGCGPFPN